MTLFPTLPVTVRENLYNCLQLNCIFFMSRDWYIKNSFVVDNIKIKDRTNKNKTASFFFKRYLCFVISGFTDVTSACCGNGKLNADIPCLPIAKYCSDRTKYLFWDRYGHPTEAAARTLVDLMLSDDSQYSSPLTLAQLISLWSIRLNFWIIITSNIHGFGRLIIKYMS